MTLIKKLPSSTIRQDKENVVEQTPCFKVKDVTSQVQMKLENKFNIEQVASLPKKIKVVGKSSAVYSLKSHLKLIESWG